MMFPDDLFPVNAVYVRQLTAEEIRELTEDFPDASIGQYVLCGTVGNMLRTAPNKCVLLMFARLKGHCPMTVH